MLRLNEMDEKEYIMLVNGSPVCTGLDKNGRAKNTLLFPYPIEEEDVRKKFGNFNRAEINEKYINLIIENYG